MARSPAPAPALPQALQQWTTRLDALLLFQQSYVQRVADFTTRVGDLTSSRSVDPGEWIENYAVFLGRVVRDFGDWVLERQSVLDEEVPLFRGELRREKGKGKGKRKGKARVQVAKTAVLTGKLRTKEGATGVPVHVPPAVFAGRPEGAKVALTTDGLLAEGGGASLPQTHIVFVPEKVTRWKPEAELKVTDVAGALPRGVYRGFVRVKDTKQVIAVVEITVA